MIILSLRTDQPKAEIGLFELDEMQGPQLSKAQGGDEERNKTYIQYDARAQKSATRQFAKSVAGVAGSAGQQGGVVRELACIKWQAHRELAETIHKKLEEILNKSSKSLGEVQGIAVFKGPGGFTGLRIGLSVANALAYSLDIPIVSSSGDDWLKEAIAGLAKGKDERIVLPRYGSPPRVTRPKK